MSSRGCFKNEAELCYFSDGEIYGSRGVALASHVVVCRQCSSRLMIWNKIKGLVYNSFSQTEAPNHMEERIRLLIVAESYKNALGYPQNPSENNGRRIASSLPDHSSFPGFNGIPFSPPRSSPGNFLNSHSPDTNTHFNDE